MSTREYYIVVESGFLVYVPPACAEEGFTDPVDVQVHQIINKPEKGSFSGLGNRVREKGPLVYWPLREGWG